MCTHTVKPLQSTLSTYRPLPYIDHFICVPNDHPYEYRCNDISPIGPFKGCPMVGRLREVLLYMVYIFV